MWEKYCNFPLTTTRGGRVSSPKKSAFYILPLLFLLSAPLKIASEGSKVRSLDWEGVTNVGCQLKLWSFVSWQSTPSWPSNVVSVLIKRQRLHLIAYSGGGGGGGGGVGGRKILFSAHPPHFLFSFVAADMWWFVIKKQVKKPLRVFPELWTSNSNVALWHSLWELTELTIHFYRYAYVFKIPGKYHGEADEHSLSTESDSGKLESTVMRLVADRGKLVVKLVGQYKRVDLRAERRACCGTKMKAVGGFNRSLKPTSSSKGDKKKNPPHSRFILLRTILFSTL